jgi:hypothetical protein
LISRFTPLKTTGFVVIPAFTEVRYTLPDRPRLLSSLDIPTKAFSRGALLRLLGKGASDGGKS